ncbi:MAG TPA: oxidoreductase [Firmicutes bacterium]|jgi:succinate dehydrogenase/fumarate reductase flavoprotein subunit|nr:oxidoreductase [Bacillota bacterium]
MESDWIQIDGMKYPLYRCHTLLIGSGAASLNCACHLAELGVNDLLMVTERLGGGTSNNAGSDKQTYYKLSLFGEGQDSVYEMARTLFDGGSMHGDIALVEASLSTREFFHLVQIGVPFPYNQFGGYVGFKTDHDPKQRATSAGPWTSNQMYQKLLVQVQQRKIPILDGFEVISLLTAVDDGEQRVIGAMALNKAELHLGPGALVVLQAENIVMGTGGPGGLYQTSVYPEGHLGSTGIALEAGATAVNLTEWQYGLASTQFRWNVSGTYQQVIPRYISTNQDGGEPREFLNDYFPTGGKLGTAIFLKGYQWPFDPHKVKNWGSSLIDILVYQENVVKKRRVFMDFGKNPSFKRQSDKFCFEELEPEAFKYLEKSGGLFGTPIERLAKLNPMAIELYAQHGIDLYHEPLEIAVCAQHNNGGLKGNIWWESNLRHLFPVGEVNGTHGVYRPGGTALNSGQVGGCRAADYIATRYARYIITGEQFSRLSQNQVGAKIRLMNQVLKNIGESGQTLMSFRKEFQERMSQVAAHIREPEAIRVAVKEAETQWRRINSGEVQLSDSSELVAFFQNRQLCLTQLAVLKSIEFYLQKGGGSRGSYLVLDPNGEHISDQMGSAWNFRLENEELRRYTLECLYGYEKFKLRWVPVRPIPADDFWFENVWRAYLDKEIYE